MSEENKQPESSQQPPADQKKQQPAPASLPPRPPTVQPPQPQAAPRPAPLPPRPAAAPPTPPSKPAPPKSSGRRTFLKILAFASAIISVVPFVPWGTFLSSSVESATATPKLLQALVTDDNPSYGAAAGVQVNVNDLATFPPNNGWIFTYPSSGNPTLDYENPNTFQKFELIRLPESLGGANPTAAAFVAYSKVCVHLWCSPNYIPSAGQYQCPCHGSIYQLPVTDPDTQQLVDAGKAIEGPASLQPFPTNAIPMMTIQADSAGNLYVYAPNFDPRTQTSASQKPAGVAGGSIEGDGVIGYGRDYASYQNFILPCASYPALVADENEAPP